jgi:hypothetical protein
MAPASINEASESEKIYRKLQFEQHLVVAHRWEMKEIFQRRKICERTRFGSEKKKGGFRDSRQPPKVEECEPKFEKNKRTL